MKKIVLGSALLAALAGPALAADMPPRPYAKAPAYTAPAVVYNWTGFYIGGHVGGAFAGDNGLQSNDARFLGGVQAGADYQLAPNWVLGAEAQYSWLSGGTNNNLIFPAGTVVNGRVADQIGSVTGRIGYTWGPGLIYAKGGVAFRDDSGLAATAGFLPAATNRESTGYTVGGGLEYMFAPAWSAKIEYQYYNFEDTTVVTPVGALSYKDDLHTVKVGVNYHFNWGGPVVAKY